MRHVWVIIGALALGLVAATPAAAQTTQAGEGKSLVVFTGDAFVPSRASVDTVVVFDGAVVVNGQVTGAVIAFNGPVTIAGSVVGDVVVFDGVLRLEADARVGGSVNADDRVIDPTAHVGGTIDELSTTAWLPTSATVAIGFAVWLAIAISVLLLGLVLLWFAPRAADAAAGAGTGAVGPTIGWGLAITIGLPMLAIVAMATIVGFPLGFGILLALALIFGVGQTTGTWVFGRMLIRTGSRAKAFLVGWAIVSAIALIPFLGGIVWAVTVVYGLGALTVAGYRARRTPAREAVLPAPPIPI
jgi:cytoskeletal protein CcmA (bactofilin family)